MRHNKGNQNSLLTGIANLPKVLEMMGYPSLRKGQDTVVYQMMSGWDTIAILPTSQGKTACFVVPTLCMGWKTLVFSPLVALMRDQVKGLHKMGIRAAQMSGTQTETENNNAANAWVMGDIDVFYVAPERLHNSQFKQALELRRPDMVVTDEAHTLSQWSDNFRPSYCKVGEVIEQYAPKVVAAFTATCPKEAEEDIRRVLGIPEAKKVIYYPRRTNLNLTSRELEDDDDLLRACDEIDGSVLVYCATIRNVERIAAFLSKYYPDQVTFYHGSLLPAQKRTNQDLFMQDVCPIVVATNAFGMGIDKGNIRGVIHYDMPGSIEALGQEVGRAGRDGLPSKCILMHSQSAYKTQLFFLSTSFPSEKVINSVFNAFKSHMDADGVVKLKQSEIAKLAGEDDASVGAAISVLTGNNVIERWTDPVKLHRIKFNGDGVDDAKFTKLKQAVDKYGVLDAIGYYDVSLDNLVNDLDVQVETIKNWVKKYDKCGWLHCVLPYTGATTRVLLPDTSSIDFDRLRKKASVAYEKLQKVLDYHKTPDEDKHSFIEKCFDIET